jgi:hypothetical protein
MGTQIITHKGKKIVYTDQRGCKGAELITNLDVGFKLVVESPEKVAVLANLTGVTVNKEFMEATKKWEPVVKPKITRQAVLITGSPMQEVLLNMYNMFTGREVRAFSSEEKAKDWLVS